MSYHARVNERGELVLPAALARAIGLSPGDTISMDREGDAIVFRSLADVVKEGQVAFRALLKQPLTVDQFIAERGRDED